MLIFVVLHVVGTSIIVINFTKVCSGVPESSAIQLEVFLCNGKSKEFTSSSHSRTSHILVVCDINGVGTHNGDIMHVILLVVCDINGVGTHNGDIMHVLVVYDIIKLLLL